MRKVERALRQAFPSARVKTTSGGHLRLQLPNGKSVIVSSTPSCRFWLRQVRADVQRNLKGPTFADADAGRRRTPFIRPTNLEKERWQ